MAAFQMREVLRLESGVLPSTRTGAEVIVYREKFNYLRNIFCCLYLRFLRYIETAVEKRGSESARGLRLKIRERYLLDCFD